MIKLILYDINKDLCEAWKYEFKDYPEVEILNLSIDKVKCDYIVTAGNSFGWMTGGIDLAARNYFGIETQDIIQREIIFRHNGELPVGDMVIVSTDEDKPNLIYLPTMRYPEPINSINVYYVFYRLLFEAKQQNFNKITKIACCGLGTGTGGVSPKECAKEMRIAYESIFNKGE